MFCAPYNNILFIFYIITPRSRLQITNSTRLLDIDQYCGISRNNLILFTRDNAVVWGRNAVFIILLWSNIYFTNSEMSITYSKTNIGH